MKKTRNNQRGNVLLIILVLIAVALVGGWQFKEYRAREKAIAAQKLEFDRLAREAAILKRLDTMVVRWNDANMIASSTSRIALATPLTALQAIKREADAFAMPDCLKDGGSALISSMDNSVQGYLIFMRNDASLGAKRSEAWFADAANLMDSYKQSRSNCKT